MSSVINTNVKALTAQGSLNAVNSKMSQAMQRLSTGMRINSSKDDAAGLAITNKMTADIRGLAVAIRNANDGLSLAQTAEGAISSINGMLQRMRELAVQSANGTSSDLARKGSQLEVEQLKQEIDNIAARTSFNGIKLLDGSAANLVLQTGSEVGQTMNLKLDSVSTSKMGVGSRPSLTSGAEFADAGDSLSSLKSGDLIINGYSIGTSQETADLLSNSSKDGSGIAKAAAINAVSQQTRVKAVVNETYMAGASMTNPGDHQDDLKINGVTVNISVTGDAGVSRTNVVIAINAVSAQTGVTATDSGDDNNGVILKAADGRNIVVDFLGGDLDSGNTGLSEGTQAASYSLQSLDGGPINISSSATGTIANAGLSSGSYIADTSILTTKARVATADNPDTSGQKFGSGTMKINGVAISGADPASDKSSDTTAQSASGVRSSSAIAIAAAINKSYDETGVKAVVNANVITGKLNPGDTYGAGVMSDIDFYLNGVLLSRLQELDGTQTVKDVVDTINSYTGETGVTVVDNGTGFTYTAADGRNISMAISNGGAAADFTMVGLPSDSENIVDDSNVVNAVTTYAQISLVSDKQFSVTAGSEGSEFFTKLGFQQGTFGGDSNGFKISEVDLSTQQGSASALQAIDAALDSVNFVQSRLGALQNRLDSAISNLTEVSRNTSESRSRILDADYATETTNLAKAQIVQQAATAMLAQANQSAQSVLSLLK